MVNISENVPLSKYSTFCIGGQADFLALARSVEDIVWLLDWSVKKKLPFVVIGSGSNVLFSDDGFRGLMIVNRASGNSFSILEEKMIIFAESGVIFSLLARNTLNAGYLGLHFGAGIPGTIGGAVVGNAGALDYDISKTLIKAKVWRNGIIENWANRDFDYSYRNSKVKKQENFVVLSAEFELKKVENKEVILGLLENDKKRRSKSYIGRTCGSYFKNPQGKSAGELIEAVGLKGFRIGDAEISPLHANVIRNVGSAKAEDILELEKIILEKVYKEHKIVLEPEIVKIGII